MKDGDVVEIVIDRKELSGSIHFVGVGDTRFGPEEGRRILADRASCSDLAPDPDLPDDTRLGAALQNVGGGPGGMRV